MSDVIRPPGTNGSNGERCAGSGGGGETDEGRGWVNVTEAPKEWVVPY